MIGILTMAWGLRSIILTVLMCVGLAGALTFARHEHAVAVHSQQEAAEARQAAAQEHENAIASVTAMQVEMVRGVAQAMRDGRRRQAVIGAGHGADRNLSADTLRALRVR